MLFTLPVLYSVMWSYMVALLHHILSSCHLGLVYLFYQKPRVKAVKSSERESCWSYGKGDGEGKWRKAREGGGEAGGGSRIER